MAISEMSKDDVSLNAMRFHVAFNWSREWTRQFYVVSSCSEAMVDRLLPGGAGAPDTVAVGEDEEQLHDC